MVTYMTIAAGQLSPFWVLLAAAADISTTYICKCVYIVLLILSEFILRDKCADIKTGSHDVSSNENAIPLVKPLKYAHEK